MSIESFQDSLFEDPIGLRFRHAREKARWTLEAVAQQLKLPVAVLDAIEREDWARLGAPIFVRSYVGSYARLLGLPESLADEVVRGRPAPPLVTIGAATPARMGLAAGPAIGYLVMILLVLAAVVAAALFYQSPRGAASASRAAPAPATATAEANRLRFTVSSDGRIARQ